MASTCHAKINADETLNTLKDHLLSQTSSNLLILLETLIFLIIILFILIL